jgi:molybdate transport system substrate-binding protein
LRPGRFLIAISLFLSACSGGSDIRVGVASSLADVVAQIADAAGIEVEIVAAGTPTLVAQQREGAGFDLLISADKDAIAGLGGEPRLLATNRLVLATPVGNPGTVLTITDLASDRPVIGLGAEGVPVGDYARAALRQAGIAPRPDTLEPSARALITKLERGELDAAIVYRTDVNGRELEWTPISTAVEPQYWFVQLSDHSTPLVQFLESSTARSLLQNSGFGVTG